MRRILLLVLLLLVGVSVSAQSRLGKVQGFAEKGGKVVQVTPTISHKVQESFPACTVTVYEAGTVTLATIYADANSTPKANPFTADSAGFYFFYIAPTTRVDIKFSGTGIAVPFTFSDIQPESRPLFDIQSYGAKGDCVTDDTAAIAATILAATTKGGAVDFTATPTSGGCYSIGSATPNSHIFFVDRNIKIIGSYQASKIKVTAATPTTTHIFKFLMGVGFESGLIVKDLWIESANNASGGDALHFADTAARSQSNVLIDHNYLAPTGGWGIRHLANACTSTEANQFRDNTISYNRIYNGIFSNCWGDTNRVYGNTLVGGDGNHTGSTNSGLDIVVAPGSTTLDFNNNNVTSRGAGLVIRGGGTMLSIRSNIFEAHLAGTTGIGGYYVNILGAVGNHTKAVNLDSNHFGCVTNCTTLGGVNIDNATSVTFSGINTFTIPVAQSIVNITANAVSTFIGLFSAEVGTSSTITNASTTTRGVLGGFYTMPGVGSGQTIHQRYLGDIINDSSGVSNVFHGLNLQNTAGEAYFYAGEAGLIKTYLKYFGTTNVNVAARGVTELASNHSGGGISFATHDGVSLSGRYKFTSSGHGEWQSAGLHEVSNAANNDRSGVIALAAATSNSKTFTAAYLNAPICSITPAFDLGAGVRLWYTSTTTTVTVNVSSAVTGNFSYFCRGNPN